VLVVYELDVITCFPHWLLFIAADMASALNRRFWYACLKLTGAERHLVRNGWVL